MQFFFIDLRLLHILYGTHQQPDSNSHFLNSIRCDEPINRKCFKTRIAIEKCVSLNLAEGGYRDDHNVISNCGTSLEIPPQLDMFVLCG